MQVKDVRKRRVSPTNQRSLFASVLVVILTWAGSFIFIRLALNEVPPVALAFARFAVATPVLVVFSLYQMRGGRMLTSALRKDPLVFAVLGLTGVTLLYVTQFYSLELISPTAGSIIINLHVVFAMLLSAALLSERLSRRKVAGVVIAFAGVALTAAGSTSAISLSLLDVVGVLLMVSAAFCWAFYTVLGKRALEKYSTTTVTCASFLLGAVFLIPFALADGGVGSLFKASWLTWCSITYLAIPSSVISYVLWNHVIREMDVTKVMVSLYVIPIPTAIMSYLVLKETITYSLILGGLIVTLGVFLTESSASTQSKAAHRREDAARRLR
jgi:drug/metabolite transporter (DMT)-like permease